MILYSYLQLSLDVQNFLVLLESKDLVYYNFFQELNKFGFRFSELKRLDLWTRNNANSWIVPTLKGNNNRIINDVNLMPFTLNQLNSRNFVYTFINESSSSYCFKSFYPRIKVLHETKSLTNHLFRHFKAKKLHEQGQTDEFIQNYFGEIDIENMRNYIYSDLYYE